MVDRTDIDVLGGDGIPGIVFRSWLFGGVAEVLRVFSAWWLLCEVICFIKGMGEEGAGETYPGFPDAGGSIFRYN